MPQFGFRKLVLSHAHGPTLSAIKIKKLYGSHLTLRFASIWTQYSRWKFQKIFERLVVAAQRSAGKTLKTSKNKKKRRHTNLPAFPTELLFAAHAQGLISLKATKNKLSVTTKWADLVEDHSVFIARYTGSKRSFQLGPNQQLQLFWDTLRLNASADLETDVVTDLDGNVITSKLHTEKGHQGLNLPRPKRTELGQFK